jgi:hypothetical protein
MFMAPRQNRSRVRTLVDREIHEAAAALGRWAGHDDWPRWSKTHEIRVVISPGCCCAVIKRATMRDMDATSTIGLCTMR